MCKTFQEMYLKGLTITMVGMRPQKSKICLPELCGCHLAWQFEQNLETQKATRIAEQRQIDDMVNPLVKGDPNKP